MFHFFELRLVSRALLISFSGKAKNLVEKVVQAKGKAKAKLKKDKLVEKEKEIVEKIVEKAEIAVRICALEAGSLKYGKEGTVSSDWASMASDTKLQVFSVSGSFEVQAGWLSRIEDAWLKPSRWKGFHTLSRFQKQQLLDTYGLQPRPFTDNTDCLLSFPESDGNFSDQHMALSISYILQQFSNYVEDVVVIGPLLQKAALETADPETKLRFVEEMRKGTIQKKLILFPVNAEKPQHWTLLRGVRGEDSSLSWLYQDTLKEQAEVRSAPLV